MIDKQIENDNKGPDWQILKQANTAVYTYQREAKHRMIETDARYESREWEIPMR
mgnify:FL=1